MERFLRLVRRGLRVGAIALAVALLVLDVLVNGGGAVLLPSGAVVAIAALARRDLLERVAVAVAASGLGTVLSRVIGAEPWSFGLAEAAGLGLLLVLATRLLPFRTALLVVPLLGFAVLALPQRLHGEAAWPDATNGLLFCVVLAIGLGTSLRVRDERRARVVERVRADERLGISRDLHDSVAHHVSGIVVRAQAAQVVAAREPDKAVEALAAIEAEGLRTLESMRRLVGMLRDPDATTRPHAGLAAVTELVARFSEGGPAASLDVGADLDDRALPEEVAVAVHRVVQEALTNVRRHAPDARSVAVRIARREDVLAVRVADDGQGGHQPSTGGFGLVGLAERIAVLGGRLDAGPQAGGGWEVAADVPLFDVRRDAVGA